MSSSELARRINTSKQNMYSVFRRKSLDSELILILSEVLEHDFFQDLRNELSFVVKESSEQYSKIEKLEKEVKVLTRLNELLEEKLNSERKTKDNFQ
jgi:hypothetical protein